MAIVSNADIYVEHTKKYHKFSLIPLIIFAIIVFIDAFPLLPDLYRDVIKFLFVCVNFYFAAELVFIIKNNGIPWLKNPINLIESIVIVFCFTGQFYDGSFSNSLLIIRLLRLFSLIRLFRFIPNVSHLIDGLTRALRASVVVFALLMALLFIFTMVGTTLFGDILPLHFGDPFTSLYTVFSVFTVEGWSTIPDQAFAQGIEHAFWIRTFFVCVLVFGGLLGMSLANSVFVDEMVSDNTEELEKQVNELKNIVINQNKLLLKYIEMNQSSSSK